LDCGGLRRFPNAKVTQAPPRPQLFPRCGDPICSSSRTIAATKFLLPRLYYLLQYTTVIPFRVDLKPGRTIYRQIVYAATKAIVSGQLRPGEEFPSVRALSKFLKINPNTAHKVISGLVEAGLLETRSGSVAVIAKSPSASKAERAKLLEDYFEELVVEAKRLGIDLPDMQEAMEMHWQRLSSKGKSAPSRGERDT
jgi:GntR family transcriptional regulator